MDHVLKTIMVSDGEDVRNVAEYLSKFRNMPVAFWTNNGGGLNGWEVFLYLASGATKEDLIESLIDDDYAKVDRNLPEGYDQAIYKLIDLLEKDEFSHQYYKLVI